MPTQVLYRPDAANGDSVVPVVQPVAKVIRAEGDRVLVYVPSRSTPNLYHSLIVSLTWGRAAHTTSTVCPAAVAGRSCWHQQAAIDAAKLAGYKVAPRYIERREEI